MQQGGRSCLGRTNKHLSLVANSVSLTDAPASIPRSFWTLSPGSKLQAIRLQWPGLTQRLGRKPLRGPGSPTSDESENPMKMRTPIIFGVAAASLSACSIFAPEPEPVVVVEEPVVQMAPAAMPMQAPQVQSVAVAAPAPAPAGPTQAEIDAARRAEVLAAQQARWDNDDDDGPSDSDRDRGWGSR